MYHYLEDKKFVGEMRVLGGEIMQDLCHILKKDFDIGANFYLVGSGARNLIMQNNREPVDLDYNLEIVRCDNFKDCQYIKECARKAFNKALNFNRLHDCEDSTSSLTSKLISFKKGKKTEFKIDVCITKRNKDEYFRLIHEKNIITSWGIGIYEWNIAPNSKKINEKVKCIKKANKWMQVRQQYADIKNKYLINNDKNHPSFICYVEAVNNVYNFLVLTGSI